MTTDEMLKYMQQHPDFILGMHKPTSMALSVCSTAAFYNNIFWLLVGVTPNILYANNPVANYTGLNPYA